MKIRNLLAALVVALLSVSTARALSTIDPTQPAQGSQLSSAVVRNNFAAAYRDVNNLLGMFAGPTAPVNPVVGQWWRDTSSTPNILKIWDGTVWVSGWSFNTTAHTITPFLTAASVAVTAPITASYSGGTATIGLSTSNRFSVNSGALVLSTGPTGSAMANCTGTEPSMQLMTTPTCRDILFSFNSALPPPTAPGAPLHAVGGDGSDVRVQVSAFAAQAYFTAAAYGGTAAVPAAVTSGTQLGGFNFFGYNGTALVGPIASLRAYANQTLAVGSQGSKACVATTTNGTTTITDRICAENDGGITVASPTGGSKGSGTINATGLYINNVAVTAAGITALTGDVSASGPGSAAATLATVNANVGTFGAASTVPIVTANGKGLITAVTTATVVAPAGTLTGTTLNASVVTSSLTSVGTLGAGTASTGFTINATNVTWSGTIPGANQAATNLAAGGNGGVTGLLALANLATIAADNVIGNFTAGVASPSSIAINNCANALTYSTTTHTFGCNVAGGTGTVTTITAGTAITLSSGATCTSTCTVSLTLGAAVGASPGNPTGTTSTTGVMMGLGSTCAFTPASTGRVRIAIEGTGENDTTNGTNTYQLKSGTGAAPANGVAATGTSRGNPLVVSYTSGTFPQAMSIEWVLTGLTLATAVWFDLDVFNTVGTRTATVKAINCTAMEF